MAVQINVRFDDDVVSVIDAVAEGEGRTRPDIVREAVLGWVDRVRTARADAAYRQAYEQHPETPEELEEAHLNAQRLVADESWEPWW